MLKANVTSKIRDEDLSWHRFSILYRGFSFASLSSTLNWNKHGNYSCLIMPLLVRTPPAGD
jgi:hypothetical protein